MFLNECSFYHILAEKTELVLCKTGVDEVETFLDDTVRESKENEVNKTDFVTLNDGNLVFSLRN